MLKFTLPHVCNVLSTEVLYNSLVEFCNILKKYPYKLNFISGKSCVYNLFLPTSCSHQDPSLWVQALSFYASREDCRDKIPQVLQHIEEQHLLQPLMVVKLLAENKCATLSDIKPYIVRHLEEQNEAINKVNQPCYCCETCDPVILCRMRN